MPGSGKSTIAAMLKKRRFKVIEQSDYLKHVMKKQHIKVNLKNVVEFGAMVKKKFGRDIMARMLIKEIKNYKGNLVMSGVRDAIDISYYRYHLKQKVILVAVVTSQKLRFKRESKRKRFHIKNYKEFLWRDRSDLKLGMKSAIDAADYVIMNTGTRAELEANVNELLRLIGINA